MSDLPEVGRAGQFGMDLPEPTDNRQRWADAAPRLAMALNEAGYPCRLDARSLTRWNRENELVFLASFPPDDVLLKAGEVCGDGGGEES